MMPRLCLGPADESLQNEADRSIFSSKFVFVLVTWSTQQKPKLLLLLVNVVKLYASQRACPTAI